MGAEKTTSAATSRRQIPHAHRWLAENVWCPDRFPIKVWDHGCGKWDDGIRFLRDEGFQVLGYDPHNRTPGHNLMVSGTMAEEWRGADVVILSNVLNVISGAVEREDVLRDALWAMRPLGRLLVSVYEGTPGKSPGKTRDGWQMNEPLSFYEREVTDVVPNLESKRRGKVLVFRNRATSL